MGTPGSHSRRLRGYCLYLAVDTEAGQFITIVLAPGRMRFTPLIALLPRQLRQVLDRRLAGAFADCGFASRGVLVVTK